MTITCPYCGLDHDAKGVPFNRKDSHYFGHVSVCSRNLPRKPLPGTTSNVSSASPVVTEGTTRTQTITQTVPASPATFDYGPEAPVKLEPLELQPGQAGPAAPGQPGLPTPGPVTPDIGLEFKAIFSTFGSRWNQYLVAEPGQPTIEAAKWTDADTDLAVNTITALDRKYGLGTLANWAPELLLITLIGNIAVKLYTGLRAKGRLKLPAGKGLNITSPLTPKEEREMSKAWEEELKSRPQAPSTP